MFHYLISRPEGWLREYLSTQMNGLTGHIGEAGYPFSIVEWGQEDFHNTDENPNWWVYEQTAYWLDGFTRLAVALEDRDALTEAARIIYQVIDHPDADGYLGPKVLKDPVPAHLEKNGKISCVRWPFVMFFRAVIALYDFNHDQRLVDAMVRHYLCDDFDYTRGRNANNLEILCWLYGVTGNREILEKAERIFSGYRPHSETENFVRDFMEDTPPAGHGVSYCEFAKIGALMYECTGRDEYKKQSQRAVAKLVRYDMLPDGCPSSQEEIAGDDPMACHETCVITDFSWALETMFAVVKDTSYGDLIERCMFNAAPGAVLENFRGLQYFSCANQLLCDHQSSHVPTTRAAKLMSYRPNPGTECCPGNVNRAMPNFALSMWAKEDGCYYACLLGPSTLRDGAVTIREETNYPFSDSLRFSVDAPGPLELAVRYPGWYRDAQVTVNGETWETVAESGFLRIRVEGGAEVTVSFATQIEIEKVHAARGVYFRRGPLVYALGQKGERRIDHEEERASAAFPAYDILPTEPWNYGIPADAEARYIPNDEAHGFDLDLPLPALEVDAVEIKNLRLRKKTVRREDLADIQVAKYRPGDYILTPDIMDAHDAETGERTRVTLKPYGACKLRVTVFTELDGQGASCDNKQKK